MDGLHFTVIMGMMCESETPFFIFGLRWELQKKYITSLRWFGNIHNSYWANIFTSTECNKEIIKQRTDVKMLMSHGSKQYGKGNIRTL